MDLVERTRFAMRHYMSTHPDTRTPFGLRGHFDLPIVSAPRYLEGCQWSDGDLTARALDAWMFSRQITGDYETGRDVEEGQYRYFLHLIDPKTGLIFVPMHSEPNRPGIYTHMWDQCRGIRHVVNRLELGYGGNTDETRALARKMLNGCVRLSRTAPFGNGETARCWPTDTYVNGQPIDKTADYGETNFVDFAVVSALLLTPVVKLYRLTGDESLLTLARELANGFLSGLEKRRESTCPMFGEDGAFYGHFHTCVNGLTGLTDLAVALAREGDEARARELLSTVERAYRWALSEDNLNRGSSCGWFPESTAHSVCDASELCCTADMIELTASMTEAGETVPGFERLQDVCEDTERYTKNELFGMQILKPEQLLAFIPPENAAEFSKELPLFWGGWAASRSWLCDYLRHYDGVPDLTTIGCCLYSGQRGFYACRRAMVKETADKVLFRFAGSYQSALVSAGELENGMSLRFSEERTVDLRVPGYVETGSVRVTSDGANVPLARSGRLLSFRASADVTYEVRWNALEWTARETVGKVNDGSIRDAETGKRITFTLRYLGSRLVEVTPKDGAFIPFETGL